MATAKIKTRDELLSILAASKEQGKKIGFTSGVFDLMHPGHVQYLEDARKLCDILVIGLNSDSSVKKYKSIHRPIISQQARAEVLAGLQSVDYIFIFDEVNNNQNVTLLKPDIYIKAGDYPLDKLSSKPLVESYGGSVATVPVKAGYSSSAIIKTVAEAYGEKHAAALPVIYDKRPALFVDRDGTLIEHVEYLHEPAKVKVFPEAMIALKQASDLGYRIVIVTNQPGIGLGYFTKEDLFRVNKEVMKAASAAGAMIDKIYYCPHSKSDGCPCRKPSTGLIKRAAADLNLDIENSYVIGDMTSDIQLGKNAGCKTVLVETGSGGKDGLYNVKADVNVKDLSELAAFLPKPAIFQQEAEARPAILYPGELQTVGYLTGKLGHDFNNLIGTLLGGLDLIKSRAKKVPEGDALFEKPLALMTTAIQKAVDLTARMRSYARPAQMELSAVSIKAVLDEAILQFQKIQGTTLPITVAAFEDIQVQGNHFYLLRILVSILENGYQATRKEVLNSIHISLQKIGSPGVMRMTIKDCGKGMSEEDLRKVFTPFQSKKSGVGIGYGLSLAMTRLNLAKMGGSISVQSKVGEGTEVHLELPCAK